MSLVITNFANVLYLTCKFFLKFLRIKNFQRIFNIWFTIKTYKLFVCNSGAVVIFSPAMAIKSSVYKTVYLTLLSKPLLWLFAFKKHLLTPIEYTRRIYFLYSDINKRRLKVSLKLQISKKSPNSIDNFDAQMLLALQQQNRYLLYQTQMLRT